MRLWQSEKDSNRQGFMGLWASSDELNPVFKIPLITSPASVPSGLVSTFTRNSTATYIDDGLVKTAGIDVIRFQNGRYLCELAATNRFLQSGTPATQVITVVSGTVYTVQCYGSGSIVLSGAGTGSVVEGAPITFTASSTSLTCTVSGSLNRAQVETGTQATSYIPTTTVPMGRVADVLHYTVGDVITQGQGSLYCEFTAGQAGQVRYGLFLSDGTLSNSIYFRLDELNRVVVKGSTGGLYTLSVPVTPGALPYNKLGITFKTDSVILYLNGAVVGEDTLFTVPTTLNKLTVGCTVLGVYQLNSEIGNIKYFKEVLTEAEAIKLTTL